MSDGADDAQRKDVLLAIAGNDAAFARLVQAHGGALRRVLRRVCGDASVADDVAQIAFLKAWRRIGSLRDAALFAPWLRRIALNAALDAVKRRGLDTAPLSDVADIAAGGEESDRRLDLDAAMRRLSFAQRACVQLAYGEGMSHAEIGEALRMPVGTVKSHIARAVPLLRVWLKDWSVEHG